MEQLRVLRHEVKYVIDSATLYKIRDKLSKVLSVDRSIDGYFIRSLYFDSIEDSDYHDKEKGNMVRKKIRIRVYDPKKDYAKLELKAKYDNNQLKESIVIDKKVANELINGHYEVLLDYNNDVANKIYLIMRQNLYRPKSLIEYQRIAFVSPSNTRITLDFNIKCKRFIDNNLFDDKINYDDITGLQEGVLEVKYDHYLEDYIRDVLSPFVSNNESFSKYVMGRNKE